jgi:hypothetical protein
MRRGEAVEETAVQMKPGIWLAHDTLDGEPPQDYSVWSYKAGSAIERTLIDWQGALSEEGSDHEVLWPHPRYQLHQITQEQFERLEMAAIHGVFRPVAVKMQQELLA